MYIYCFFFLPQRDNSSSIHIYHDRHVDLHFHPIRRSHCCSLHYVVPVRVSITLINDSSFITLHIGPDHKIRRKIIFWRWRWWFNGEVSTTSVVMVQSDLVTQGFQISPPYWYALIEKTTILYLIWIFPEELLHDFFFLLFFCNYRRRGILARIPSRSSVRILLKIRSNCILLLCPCFRIFSQITSTPK